MIAQDLECIAMKIVGAGCHVVGDGALPQSKLRVKRRAIDAELAYCFIGRIDIGLIPLELDKCDGNTIELNIIFIS